MKRFDIWCLLQNNMGEMHKDIDKTRLAMSWSFFKPDGIYIEVHCTILSTFVHVGNFPLRSYFLFVCLFKFSLSYYWVRTRHEFLPGLHPPDPKGHQQIILLLSVQKNRCFIFKSFSYITNVKNCCMGTSLVIQW